MPIQRTSERAALYQQLGGFVEPALSAVHATLVETRHGPEALAALRCPVLLVAGTHDALFPPALIRASAARIADARVLVIPGASHSPYFEEPAAWNRAVADFLGIELD